MWRSWVSRKFAVTHTSSVCDDRDQRLARRDALADSTLRWPTMPATGASMRVSGDQPRARQAGLGNPDRGLRGVERGAPDVDLLGRVVGRLAVTGERRIEPLLFLRHHLFGGLGERAIRFAPRRWRRGRRRARHRTAGAAPRFGKRDIDSARYRIWRESRSPRPAPIGRAPPAPRARSRPDSARALDTSSEAVETLVSVDAVAIGTSGRVCSSCASARASSACARE